MGFGIYDRVKSSASKKNVCQVIKKNLPIQEDIYKNRLMGHSPKLSQVAKYCSENVKRMGHAHMRNAA